MTNPTIFDIAPPEIGSKEVDIRGTKLRVSGIGLDDWTVLYIRFPELAKGAAGGAVAVDDGNFKPLEAVQMEAAVCAAGFGMLGDKAAELAIINNLTREERQQVMLTAIDLSRPADALGPLLDGGAAVEAGSSG